MAKTTVSAGYIAANAITSTELAANSVTAAAIASGAILSIDIGANSVSSTAIAANAVNTSEIASNAVSTAQIASNAVTAASIATNAVGADQISPNAVKASELASDALSGQNFTGDVTFDTNVLFVDSVNNRVGIGITSPARSLHIRSTGESSGLFLERTSNYGFVLYNEIETTTETFHLGFVNNGTFSSDILVANESGRVGIGTTNPTTNLDVAGVIRSKADAALNDAQIGKFSFYNTNSNASANPERAYIFGGRQNSAWGGYLSFYTSTGTDAATEAMRIQSDGALKLSEKIILGSFTHGVANSGEALIGKAGDRAGGTMTIQLGGSSATSTRWEIVDRAWTKIIAQISGEAPENSFVVTSSGNVGIGVGDPDALLDISGAGTSQETRGLQITATAASGYAEAQFIADSREWRIGSGGSTGIFPNMFYIYDQGSGYGRFLIDSSGNVSIGSSNTSPSGKLHVDSGLAHNACYITTGASGGTGYDASLNILGGANNSEMSLNMGIVSDADRDRIKTYQANMIFTTNNVDRMTIDSSGRIRMPYQPAFCVANSPGTYPVAGIFGKSDNPTAGSSYTLHVNQGSHFSTSTGRFTAPTSGVYYFSFSAMFDNNTSTSPGFDFKVNGSSAYGGEGLSSGTASYEQLAGSILLTLSANDYVELSIRGSRIHQRYGSFEGFLLA